eukprot:g174.t1
MFFIPNSCMCSANVGKTSLIRTLVSEHFSQDSDEVLESWLREVNITPDNMGTEKVSLTIIDTPSFSWRSAERQGHSSSLPESEDHVKKKENVCRELERASVVVLVYDISRNSTFVNVKHYWLPLIRDSIDGSPKPVVLVGNKLDTQPKAQMRRHGALTQKFAPILKAFKNVDACLQCSCKNLLNIQEVFYYARKAVIYPVKPLFDLEGRQIRMKDGFMRALERCFRVFDRDRDNVLCDSELRRFQSICFDTSLQDADIDGVHKVLAQKGDNNVSMSMKSKGRGITLDGFLCLNRLFLERNLSETSWLVLRYLNYRVRDSKMLDTLELVAPERVFDLSAKLDQSVELTDKARNFLYELFHQFDRDNKGYLSHRDVKRIMGACPPEYWSLFPTTCFAASAARATKCDDDHDDHEDDAEPSGEGRLDLDYWISLWSATTLLRPDLSQRYFYYLGYNLPADDVASAYRVTHSRARDFSTNDIKRDVFRIFVFGRRGVGKTSLLKNISRPSVDIRSQKTRRSDAAAKEDLLRHYVGNGFDHEEGEHESVNGRGAAFPTLIFTEWPFESVMQGLDAKQSLASVLSALDDASGSNAKNVLEACDAAVLMFEPSSVGDVDDDGGFGAMVQIQKQLAKHVPCFYVCNKWDKRPTGFEASEEWARILQHCRSLKLRLPVSRPGEKRSSVRWTSSSTPTMSQQAREDAVPLRYSATSAGSDIEHARIFENIFLVAKRPQSMCPMFASRQQKLSGDSDVWNLVRAGLAIGALAVVVAASGYAFWYYRHAAPSSKKEAAPTRSKNASADVTSSGAIVSTSSRYCGPSGDWRNRSGVTGMLLRIAASDFLSLI